MLRLNVPVNNFSVMSGRINTLVIQVLRHTVCNLISYLYVKHGVQKAGNLKIFSRVINVSIMSEEKERTLFAVQEETLCS